MTTLDNRHCDGADNRSTSNTAAQPVISSNVRYISCSYFQFKIFIYMQEYEVSNLYESSLALPEDEILQPVMHILREDNSEGDEFDVSLSDSEKYKLVDDMSEDFTADPADFQESTDSDDSGDAAYVVSTNESCNLHVLMHVELLKINCNLNIAACMHNINSINKEVIFDHKCTDAVSEEVWLASCKPGIPQPYMDPSAWETVISSHCRWSTH